MAAEICDRHTRSYQLHTRRCAHPGGWKIRRGHARRYRPDMLEFSAAKRKSQVRRLVVGSPSRHIVPKSVRTLLDARLYHPCKWGAAARWEPLPQPSTSIVECGGNSDRLARISLELSSLSTSWQTARWKSDPLDSGLRLQELSKIWPSRADTGTTLYSACSLLTEL